MEFIQLIFLSNRKAEQILEILEKKYDILLEKEEEKKVRKMCTFSEALIEKGELRGEIKGEAKGTIKGILQGKADSVLQHNWSKIILQPTLSRQWICCQWSHPQERIL